MLRKHFKPLLFILLITGMGAAVFHMATTIKNSVDMRSGPGSYYPLVVRLNPGAEVTELDQQQQWLKVETVQNNKVGWIPERSIYLEDEEETSSDSTSLNDRAQQAFDQMSGNADAGEDDPYASPAQIAAAVKGFAKDFAATKTDAQTTDVLENFDGFVNPTDYEQFRNQRLDNWSWETAQSRFPINTSKAASLNPVQEQIGWGIANVIAQRGLIKNEGLQRYLTHVALVVAENSHRYETPVQVYILDSDEVTGYACPNGAIFVSKGALQLMDSEGEFAFFVAHELAHVVLSHGVKETRKRKPKIMAEQRFEELNQEMGERDEKYVKVEEELTQMANQMYEYVVKKRLNRYEFEADYWGVLYAYRTGYNPQKGLNLIRKIYDYQGDFEQKIGHAKWDGASLEKRMKKIQDQMSELDIPADFGLDYEVSFQEKLRVLGE